MTLRAVRVEIRTRAVSRLREESSRRASLGRFFNRPRLDSGRTGRGDSRRAVRFGAPDGKAKFAVQLPRLHAEHKTRVGRVASETILAAWIIPWLRATPVAVWMGIVSVRFECEQVCVAVVRPPFVSHPINAAVRIADQQARFEAAFRIRFTSIGRSSKVFTNTVPRGKTPFAVRREFYFLIVRHGNPARFLCAIRPEGNDEVIRNQSRRRV